MPKRPIQTLVVASIAAAFVITQGPFIKSSPLGLASDVAGELNHLNEIPTRLADATRDTSRTGRHLGFDTYSYPGDEVMQAWREDGVPYEWVGYYLPAPCHEGTDWVGKREKLASMGWGMAVVYVGQQTWDKIPTGYETRYRAVRRTVYLSKRVKTHVRRNGKRVVHYVTRRVPTRKTVHLPYRVAVVPTKRDILDCNAQLVNATRGTMEANDAITRTWNEGFPAGTVVYLDIEYMDHVPAKMRDYYRAWTRQVLADGRYRPGYYVHTRNASSIYEDVKAEYTAAGLTIEPPFWVAGGSDFSPDKRPQDVGHAFAAVWQGMLDVVQEWNGYKLPIDVNVAQVPNPSSQFVNAN